MSYKSIEELNKAIASASEGAGATTFSRSIATTASVSVRSEYNRGHYDFLRPSEKIPTTDRDIMIACNMSYYNVGIVRNIVDLMADFCVKGIDWAHKNRNVEAFYKSWFKKVNGYDVSERFCNYLVRLGNTCVYTNYGKVPESVCNEWKKTRGAEFENIKTTKCNIPSSYIFLDITSLSEIFPEVGRFSKNRMFILSLSNGLINTFSPTFNKQKMPISGINLSSIIDNIPDSLKRKISENDGNLVLTEDDIKLFHYKKDDWNSWAKPLLYSILEPLILLQKMHLADMSALDGAISNIRLWKVGYIDQNNALNSIIPTKAMLNKVREIVQNNLSGGVLDLFWGPDLDFKESSSQVYRFLTSEKYKHVMALIYDGMGVPPSLTAGGGSGSDGFTNNFISMKVLIEKLNYLRNKLIQFWTEEAKQVQLAMGFSSPAQIVFDDAILSDESQYKQLLLDLYDRDIISLEGIRNEFNLIDPIETGRILRETKRRVKDKTPPKAGPYHDPMVKQTLQQDMVKNGLLDPTILGLEVSQKEIKKNLAPQDGGRPLGAKDKLKRKTKVVRPRTSAEIIETHVWAREAMDNISTFINPLYLVEKSKAYIRELSDADVNELENLKFAVLCAHEPFSEINEESIHKACLNLPNTDIEKTVFAEIINNFQEKFNRSPMAEDKRIAYAAAYSLVKNG